MPPDDWRERRHGRHRSLYEELLRIKRNLWWLVPLVLLFGASTYSLLDGLWLYLNDPT